MTALTSRIAGYGHYAPQRIVENATIERDLALPEGWIERRTGIRQRHWAEPHEALTDIALPAAEMALSGAGVSRNDIAFTLLATSTPDHLLPPSAPLLAWRLGLAHSGAADLAGACTGFIHALTMADGLVRLHGRPVLIVAANILSRRINSAERGSAVLFADAAGAVVLAPSDIPGAGLVGADMASDGSGYALISIPAGGSRMPFSASTPPEEVRMRMPDGQAVFSQAVRLMTRCAEGALAQARMTAGQIDHFVPHQANQRMSDAVADKLGISRHRLRGSIAEYGNSSAATIPLTLSIQQGLCPFQKGSTLLMTAAGAGLTAGAIVWRF